MKLAIITDLHANAEAMTAVLAHARNQGADRYALLGDFVGYGAEPSVVIEKVRELVADGAIVVGGNHDAAVVRGALPTMRPDARAVVAWTREQLNDSQLDFLDSLPLTHEEGELLFVHANAWNPPGWDYIHGRMEAERSLKATRARISFCGHMHEPRLYHLGLTGVCGDFVTGSGQAILLAPPRRWLVIPGSCGQPRDGDPAACYALFDIDQRLLTPWRVPYDHLSAAAKMRAASLPPALADRLAVGT